MRDAFLSVCVCAYLRVFFLRTKAVAGRAEAGAMWPVLVGVAFAALRMALRAISTTPIQVQISKVRMNRHDAPRESPPK